MWMMFAAMLISIHALREEGDSVRPAPPSSLCYFYPRPPRGGRPRYPGVMRKFHYFYPRPPRGGRLHCWAKIVLNHVISIHALREEGDGFRKTGILPTGDISIHALREEGDAGSLRDHGNGFLFLSTPSARRATPAAP